MAEPVRARRLTDQEGRRLQQIVRRGKHGSVRVRRAMIIMASASGTPVPAIARLVAADEDTVRDVVHLFNAKGLAALDPQWAGGRPRLISDDDIAIIVEAATTRPEKLGLPVTCWSLRKLAAYLAGAARPVAIGRERLRQILHAQGISFQRTRTWKESTDPVREAKLDRIEHVTSHFPDRCFAFDQFGPLSIRPTHGSSWARRSKPARLRATYRRTQGIRYFHGCYRLADDQLWGITRERKGGDHTLAALKSIRARCPGGYRLYVILDNLSANKTPAIRRWARQHNVELCFTPTNASWANPIEAQFGPIRTFVMGGSDHPNHTVLARKLQEHLRWRNANARHPDVLAAQRRERARIRSQRQQRWGRPASKPPDPVNVRGHRTSEYPVSVPCRYRLPAPFGSVRPNVSGSGSTTRRVCGSAGAVNSRSSAPSCCSLVWAEIRATTGRLSLNRRHLVPPLRKTIPAWTLLRDALQHIRD
jgi:transposase